jgi:hypothetical protein
MDPVDVVLISNFYVRIPNSSLLNNANNAFSYSAKSNVTANSDGQLDMKCSLCVTLLTFVLLTTGRKPFQGNHTLNTFKLFQGNHTLATCKFRLRHTLASQLDWAFMTVSIQSFGSLFDVLQNHSIWSDKS